MNVVPSQDFIHAIGWCLVHFLWQGALIGLAYALLRALVSKEQSEIRYAAGLVALGAMAIAPLLTLWVLRPLPVLAIQGDASALPPLVVSAEAVGQPLLGSFDLSWLVAAWAAGVILMTARAAHQWRALERVASRLAWQQADVDALFADVAKRFGRFGGVRVLVSSHIDTPTLIGWFKPVVLLPAAVVLGFPRHQLELILAHELGHLRRLDHLVNLAQTVVETLLFYHPAVHWISREVRHEREVCCDRLVLRLTEGEPREYARTLAALETLRQLPPQLAVAASGGRLLDRVRRIIGSPSPQGRRPRGVWVSMAAGTGALAIVLLASSWNEDISSVETRFEVSASVDAEHALAFQPSIEAQKLAVLPELVSPVMNERSLVRSSTTSKHPLESSQPAVEEVAMLPITPAAAPTLEGLMVSDVEANAIAIPVAVAPRKPASRLKLSRRVDPVYPELNSAESRGHVEFEFSVDRDGSVRDISVVSGDAEGAFANAARRALRQWVFDSRTAAGVGGRRFRQDFVFEGISRGVAGEGEDDETCRRATGSHLCRPARALGLTTEVELGKGVTEAGKPILAAVDAAPPTSAIGNPRAALPLVVDGGTRN